MSESATERFERLAQEFYDDTGMMAPGKDAPVSLGEVAMDERWSEWREWLAGRRKKRRDECEAALAGIEDPEGFVRSVREVVEAADGFGGCTEHDPTEHVRACGQCYGCRLDAALAAVREHLPDEEATSELTLDPDTGCVPGTVHHFHDQEDGSKRCCHCGKHKPRNDQTLTPEKAIRTAASIVKSHTGEKGLARVIAAMAHDDECDCIECGEWERGLWP